MCVFIALKGHSFYNLFIFARTQGPAKLSRRSISIACYHSRLCYMSCVSLQGQTSVLCLFTRPDKLNRVSFPACAQRDLLSLLMCNRVFSFPAGVQKGLLSLPMLHIVFFPAGAFQISYFKNFAMATKHLIWFGFYSPFKNISLISSRSFIKGGRKLENPGEKPPDNP